MERDFVTTAVQKHTTRNTDWHFVQTRVSTACLFYEKINKNPGYGSSVLLSSVIFDCMILCGSSSNTMCFFIPFDIMLECQSDTTLFVIIRCVELT